MTPSLGDFPQLEVDGFNGVCGVDDHHEQVLDTMLGQVGAWAGALAPLRAA
jgi:hypothetical protein